MSRQNGCSNFLLVLLANNRRFLHLGGGVGQALAQLCKTVENVTVIGTASKAKHEQLADICQHLLERESYSVGQVKKIAENGVDLVLDCSCGEDVSKVRGRQREFYTYSTC